MLRRLSKRDAVTKLKALEELQEYLSSLPDLPGSLLPLLPAFVSAYCRLCLDNDRRVRLALYAPLSFVLTQSRKQAAPFLRQLFPYWWSHQHEAGRDVSRAAAEVWQAVFSSPDKELAALLHVRAEYCQWLQHVLAASVQSLSDVSAGGQEAAEERYDRMLSSSLLGLAGFLSRLQQQENETQAAAFAPLLSQAVGHLSSKRPSIRRAAFVLLTACVQHQPGFVQSQLPSLSPLVVNAVSEREVGLQPAVWDLLLSLLRAFPPAVDCLPPEPRRWRALLRSVSEAGHGNSRLLHSQLLPLLSTLPPASISQAFCLSFFSALSASASRLSGQEVEAMRTAYLECGLLLVVSRKRDRPSISRLVLHEALLPFIAQLLINSQQPVQPGSKQTVVQAGTSLAVIERHLSEAGAEGAVHSGQEHSGGAEDESEAESEAEARAVLFSLPQLFFRLQELCFMTMESEERQDGTEAAAAGQTEAVDDGGRRASSSGLRQRSGWKRVQELLCAMQEERQRRPRERNSGLRTAGRPLARPGSQRLPPLAVRLLPLPLRRSSESRSWAR